MLLLEAAAAVDGRPVLAGILSGGGSLSPAGTPWPDGELTTPGDGVLEACCVDGGLTRPGDAWVTASPRLDCRVVALRPRLPLEGAARLWPNNGNK